MRTKLWLIRALLKHKMHWFNTKDIQGPQLSICMNYFLTQRQTRAKPCVFTAHFACAYIVFSKQLNLISKCNKKSNGQLFAKLQTPYWNTFEILKKMVMEANREILLIEIMQMRPTTGDVQVFFLPPIKGYIFEMFFPPKLQNGACKRQRRKSGTERTCTWWCKTAVEKTKSYSLWLY